jgi:hypothetical protein
VNDDPTYDVDALLRIIPVANRDQLKELNRKVIEERLLYDVNSLIKLLLEISKRLMELGPPFEKQKGLINNIAPHPTYSTAFLRKVIPLANYGHIETMAICIRREQGLYNLLDYCEILTLFDKRLIEISNS